MTTIMYGTTQGVATLTRQYADNRGDSVDFTGVTKPTNAQLLRWLEQLSAMFNTALRTFGFEAPVLAEYTDPYNEITMYVEQLAATLVEGINGFQRHASSKSRGWSLVKELSNMRELIYEWIEDNSIGLEIGGLPRPNSDLGSMMVKETEFNIIFRRGQYGQSDTTT